MTLARRTLLGTAALAGALSMFAAGPAAGAAPCWKALINDWYDGRIDSTYPVPCYRDAIKHAPTDIDTYSSLREDIGRALQDRVQGGSGVTGDATERSETASGPPFGRPGPGRPGPTVGPGSPGRRDPSGPVPGALKGLGPDDADSVPIPLLVLGSLALLLLAAGSAGLIARRIQSRRVQIQPATESPPAQNS